MNEGGEGGIAKLVAECMPIHLRHHSYRHLGRFR